MAYTLVLGSKNLSSWSLRPYLALRATGVQFNEIVIRLDQPDTKAKILAHSPAGKVPVLKDEGLLVWDSLAICETLAERHPEAKLWPDEPALRAKARAYAAEMHSAFPALRQTLPMNFARVLPCPALSEAVKADIARIVAAWSDALDANPGGFLFGRFSIADCMYAPVVSRFHTYGVAVPPVVQTYSEKMMALPAMQDWMAAAKAEVGAGS
jgi:glutathione S-transferase